MSLHDDSQDDVDDIQDDLIEAAHADVMRTAVSCDYRAVSAIRLGC